MGPLFWTDRNECFPQLGYRKTNYWSLLNTTMSRLVCRPPFRLCENGVPHTIVKTTIVKKQKKNIFWFIIFVILYHANLFSLVLKLSQLYNKNRNGLAILFSFGGLQFCP